MTKDKALKLALDALELEDMACRYEKDPTPEHIAKAITALREALAQPAQRTWNNGGKTGWPPGLLQDDCKGLSKWLANQPDAKRRVREALAGQPAQQEPVVCKHEWFRTGAMEPRECRCIKCGAWNTTNPKNEREHAAVREIERLQEALAQPEQEPVAWQFMNGSNFRKRRPDDFAELDSGGLPYWKPLYTQGFLPDWANFKEGRAVGWTEAMERISEKIKEMPWENDTKDSFLVWLEEQS